MNTTSAFVSARTDGVPVVGDPGPEDASRIGWLGVLAATAGLVTTAAMIATPLLPRGGGARRALSSVVVVGLAATTTANAARRWGFARTGVAAVAVGVSTAVVERVGTQTGVPFGRYQYSGDLRPQIAGVPAIVPLAWLAMALPAREAAHSALGARSSAPGRVLVGAAALTAWDLFLDPQMVGEGYWRWTKRGRLPRHPRDQLRRLVRHRRRRHVAPRTRPPRARSCIGAWHRCTTFAGRSVGR